MKFSFRVLAAAAIVVSVILYFLACQQCPTSKAFTYKSTDKTRLAAVSAQTTVTLTNDTNWAGYIISSDVQNPLPNVTSVSASWTVPTVKISSQDTFSAVWIGIGGYFDNTLIQTGTEQDSIQGQSQYSAWVELLPRSALTISTLDVSPGDQISASIQLIDPNADQWSIDIKDLTTKQEYSTSVFYACSQLSAEWIVERPDVSSTRSRGTLAVLADVGGVTFTNCQATIGGTNGTISSFPTTQTIMYQTVQPATNLGVTQLAVVSGLSDNGSSFTVETSSSVIPELSVLIMIPILLGVSLLATIKRRHMRAERSQE